MLNDETMDRRDVENQLAQDARNGNREAWHQLYDRTVRPLFAFIHRRVSTSEAAEEIVQDTYMTAIDALSRFDTEKGSFFNWLCGIGWRKSQEYYRKSGRAPTPASSLSLDLEQFTKQVATNTVPEDVLYAQEVQDLIGEILTEMTEEHREFLESKYVRGESVETIANRVGKSSKAVESALTRARKAFQERFTRLASEYVPPQIRHKGGGNDE